LRLASSDFEQAVGQQGFYGLLYCIGVPDLAGKFPDRARYGVAGQGQGKDRAPDREVRPRVPTLRIWLHRKVPPFGATPPGCLKQRGRHLISMRRR
jgi:hypothetical protein